MNEKKDSKNSIILIQSRSNSSRLPAKALLPICDMPMVVLVAKRAANSGKRVLVVTSENESDDLLCKYLKTSHIEYFRGSLDNTLDRFIMALSDFNDDTIIHRLTADNVFPDGNLVDEIEQDFISKRAEYLMCNGIKSGLPYGLSVETFRLISLREAYKETNLPYDLEHVTPYIRRNKVVTIFDKYLHLDLGSYSCTIDTYYDYQSINKVFDDVEDAVKINWQDLLNRLIMTSSKNIDKLVLGSVQFGLEYGINNNYGKPSDSEVEKILKTAINGGIQVIDTARDYGNSENLLGKSLSSFYKNKFKISSKLSSLNECPDDAEAATVRVFVRESVLTSCTTLKVECIDYLLLHRVEQVYKWNGVVLDTLLDLRNEGFIGKIGASIQNIDELDLMLNNKEILIIQMPFNILDRRWSGLISKIIDTKKERGLIVHARSVFLQGLLLTKDSQKWNSANVSNSKDITEWLNAISEKHNQGSIIETCLTYVKSQNWIDGVVIGVDTQHQLQHILEIFSHRPMTIDTLQDISHGVPVLSEATLNPSNWRK